MSAVPFASAIAHYKYWLRANTETLRKLCEWDVDRSRTVGLHYKFIWAHKIEDLFPEEGFTFLGSGLFARTYLSPCKRFALKVNFRSDSAYDTFVELAQRRQDNPFYPRIYVHMVEEGLQVTLMEALEEVKTSTVELRAMAVKIKYQALRYEGFVAMKYPPHYVQLLEDLSTTCESNPIALDMHLGNMMLRPEEDGTPQLVVTDPFRPRHQ